ncbi:S46 family peptidase, partial [Bacteroides heparinolyticus]
GVRLEVLRKFMNASDKTRIQYASKFAGSSNYWKNSIGMNKAIIDNDVLNTKAEIEKRYAEFAKGKPEYEGVVEKIDAIIEKGTPTLRQLYYTNEALRGAIEFGSTYLIMDNIKKALEEKNDSLLQASKKQLEEAYDGIHNKDYDHEVDRAVAKAILPALAKALNADELPDFYNTIRNEFKGDYDAYVDNLYDNSILSNRSNLDKFLKKPTVKAIERDPATAYSRSKNLKIQELGKAHGEQNNGLDLLHKAYIRGLGEMKQPMPSYPDANFTIRLTYGNVKAYSPKDAVYYNYYTTTDGILEKENPENREFMVPAKLKELIQKKDFGRYAMKDGTMPVCFLTTNDITGGNSGSPVINAEGHLIGTAFDGNWESLSGDINFDNNLQRCINLDIRYVLFILEKLGNCEHLIKEMNIIE